MIANQEKILMYFNNSLKYLYVHANIILITELTESIQSSI
jgi:hypothetical protein